MKPKTDKIPPMLNEEVQSVSEKVENFTVLLDSIGSLSEKKKALWKDIYRNALVDRNNANILITSLLTTVISSSSEHAIHGQNINKYIERMSKANDQLIKLAELIENAERDDSDLGEGNGDKIDSEDVYSQISKNK